MEEMQDVVKSLEFIAKSMELNQKRFDRVLTALIISIILGFVTNAIWIYEWNQYDYEIYSVEQENGNDGINTFNTGEMGDAECGKK